VQDLDKLLEKWLQRDTWLDERRIPKKLMSDTMETLSISCKVLESVPADKRIIDVRLCWERIELSYAQLKEQGETDDELDELYKKLYKAMACFITASERKAV
jgi:hypothetical protein